MTMVSQCIVEKSDDHHKKRERERANTRGEDVVCFEQRRKMKNEEKRQQKKKRKKERERPKRLRIGLIWYDQSASDSITVILFCLLINCVQSDGCI